MTSLSDYRLGCLIHADPAKDEWFAQIVEPWSTGTLGFQVVATATARGKEAVLEKVRGFAGIDRVPPRAMYNLQTPAGVVHAGLTDAMQRCETALQDLIRDLRRMNQPEQSESW